MNCAFTYAFPSYPIQRSGAPDRGDDLPLAPGYPRKKDSMQRLRRKASSLTLSRRKSSTVDLPNAVPTAVPSRPTVADLGRKESAASTDSLRSLSQRIGGGLRRMVSRQFSQDSLKSKRSVDSIPASASRQSRITRHPVQEDDEAEAERAEQVYEIDTEERQMSSFWNAYLAGHAVM